MSVCKRCEGRGHEGRPDNPALDDDFRNYNCPECRGSGLASRGSDPVRDAAVTYLDALYAKHGEDWSGEPPYIRATQVEKLTQYALAVLADREARAALHPEEVCVCGHAEEYHDRASKTCIECSTSNHEFIAALHPKEAPHD